MPFRTCISTTTSRLPDAERRDPGIDVPLAPRFHRTRYQTRGGSLLHGGGRFSCVGRDVHSLRWRPFAKIAAVRVIEVCASLFIDGIFQRMAHCTSSLGDALSVICSDHPTRVATRQVVDTAHRLARAYLMRRQSAGLLSLDVLGLTINDLAMDCIAHLFTRDETGEFPELQRFFADQPLDTFDAADAHRSLRCLVTRAVGDHLFRCYQTADPGLGRIIRNLKRAIRQSTHCRLERRGATLHVVLVDGSTGTRLLSPDRMAAHLTVHLTGTLVIPTCLNHVLSLLDAHADAHPYYPVSLLAQSIRMAQRQVQTTDVACDEQWPSVPASSHHLAHISPDTIRTALYNSVRSVREAKRAQYSRDHDRAAWYQTYMRGVQTYLEATYVPPGRSSFAHHDALREHRPSLTREHYREQHRHTFEYLLRCTRDVFIQEARSICPSAVQFSNVTNLSSFQQLGETGRSI